MAVETPGTDYEMMRARWQIARDCAAGSHEIKARGTAYLPALAGHNPGVRNDPYWDYVGRSLYFNGVGRTIDGLIGMVFRRAPIIEAPNGAEDLIADVDLVGRSLEELAKGILRELLTVGRVAVLVDHTVPPTDPRPYMRLYCAEDILDIVEEVRGGSVVVVQARLREVFEQPKEGVEFESEEIVQIRVLELIEGRYQQRVFRQSDEDAFREFETITPTIDDSPIDEIPLWVFSVDEGAKPRSIEPPPLLDLCEVNLAHYRQEADYRNALHMAGVPTLAVSGMDEPTNPIKVGSAEVFFMPPADAKAYYVSYGAEGAAAIRQSLDDLQQMMAFLGARMLQPEKRAAEAAETARIHRMGEISILGSIAHGINARLGAAFRFMLRWALFQNVDNAVVELNDDFLPMQAPAQLLSEMVKAWQSGAVSHDSLWRFAQEGELVDPRRTVEEEMDLIAQEKPRQISPPPVAPDLSAGPNGAGPVPTATPDNSNQQA